MEAVTESRGVIGVGYEGKTLEAFIYELLASKTQLLVDVRLNPISRKAGFSKRILAGALDSAGISYCHAPQLGNPAWNRPGFSGTTQEVRAAREKFGEMLACEAASTALRQIAEAAASGVVAVMCVESDDRACHRYVILSEVHRLSRQCEAVT